jgi:iron complex outermembrane receptor protein
MTKHQAAFCVPSRDIHLPVVQAPFSFRPLSGQRSALLLGLCSATVVLWALNSVPDAFAEEMQLDAVNIDAHAGTTEADNVEHSRTSYQARQASVATRTDARLVEVPQSVNVVRQPAWMKPSTR